MQKIFVPENDTLGHILYLPETDDLTDMPLLVYLHGAGERGTKLEHLYRHGLPKLIEEGRTYDAIVLCPQCPAYAVWDNVPVRLKYTIDQVVQKYNIKKDRILCTGSSMGGFGTFMMGMSYRNFFAGIAPVAGGGMSWRADNLETTPVYVIHGDADLVVPVQYCLMMVAAMEEKNIQHKVTIYEGSDHGDSIDKAYRDGHMIEWLLQQRRSDFSYVPETAESIF